MMRLNRLERTQNLPISLDEAWSFFCSPHNLPDITPPSLRFVITSDLPGKMYPGMLITYSVTPFFNIPWTWITEISHVVEPYLFVDRQLFGPYLLWHHEHHFRETAEGIQMRDLVTYALPFGSLAKPVLPFVERRLEEIFDFRRKQIEEIFVKRKEACK